MIFVWGLPDCRYAEGPLGSLGQCLKMLLHICSGFFIEGQQRSVALA